MSYASIGCQSRDELRFVARSKLSIRCASLLGVTSALKVKNAGYSQLEGREQLFENRTSAGNHQTA